MNCFIWGRVMLSLCCLSIISAIILSAGREVQSSKSLMDGGRIFSLMGSIIVSIE